MKHVVNFFIIFSLVSMTSIRSDDVQAKKAALEMIASISDDIATLVINHRYEKNREIAKVASIQLITTLADAIAQVIVKIKERKEVRNVDLYSDEEYDQAIIIVAEQFVEKIENQKHSL